MTLDDELHLIATVMRDEDEPEAQAVVERAWAIVAAAQVLWNNRDAVPSDQVACRRLYEAWRDLGAALNAGK